MAYSYTSPSGNGILYDGIMGYLDDPTEEPETVTSRFKGGIMAPATSIRPEARPAEEVESEDPSVSSVGIVNRLISSLGDYTDDPEALANAVIGRPTGTEANREAALAEYEDLPPAPTMSPLSAPTMSSAPASQTEAAIPTAVPTKAEKGFDAEVFTDSYLESSEGTEAHPSLEGGRDTAAYGVKHSRGLDRGDYSSDREFAAAVADLHYRDVERDFNSQDKDLNDMPRSVINALVDLNYNAGTIGSSAEKETPEDMLRNTLEFIGVTTSDSEKGSLLSLATRRAKNWNAASSDLGLPSISSIEQLPSDGGTSMVYYDADGNVVHRVESDRKPITFTGGTDYRVNTQARRAEL